MLKKYLPISLYVLLPLMFHAPIWLGVVDFYTGEASDLIPYVYGLKSLIFNSIRESGELPLWNPYVMFGQPVVGNIQYALFYPLGFLFVAFSFFKALWIGQVVHMAVAGYGAYRLTEYYGCAKTGSIIAGLLYMFNGRLLYYINAGWVGYFYALCWVPLFIFMAVKVLEEKDLKGPLYFGVVFAMSLLCGTPQYAFMGFFLFLLHGLWLLITSGTGKEKLSLLYRVLLSGMLAFLLSAVQLFPSAEQVYLSSRKFLDPSTSGFHLDWNLQQWFQILFRPEFLPHDFSWELSIYMGIGGVIFAALGLLAMRRRILFLMVWGLAPMLLSLGAALPMLDSFIKLLPGIGMLSNASRYLIFTSVVLSVAAGFGLERFLVGGSSKKVRFAPVVLAGLIMGIGMIIPPAWGAEAAANTRLGLNVAIFIVLAGLGLFWKQKLRLGRWILICWLIADPLLIAPAVLNGYRVQDIQPPAEILEPLKYYPGPVRAAFLQPVHLNDNLISPLEDWVFTKNQIGRAGGYEPLALQRTLNFLGKMDATEETVSDAYWGFRLFGFGRPRLYNLAGITHILTTAPLSKPQLNFVATDTLNAPDFHGGWWRDQKIYLYENSSVLSRAIFMPDNFTGDVTPVAQKADAVNRRQLELDVEVPGTVILSESFHSGWIGMEKGAPLVIKPFVDMFISFRVAAGHHLVTLEFLPQSYRLGRWLSVAGIILAAFLYGYARHSEAGRRRYTTPEAKTPFIR